MNVLSTVQCIILTYVSLIIERGSVRFYSLLHRLVKSSFYTDYSFNHDFDTMVLNLHDSILFHDANFCVYIDNHDYACFTTVTAHVSLLHPLSKPDISSHNLKQR